MDKQKSQTDAEDGVVELRSKANSWRIVAGVFVAMLVVSGATAAAAGAFSEDADAPSDVQSAIDGVFAEGECTDGATASDEIPAALTELGYDNWRVEARPGADSSACVAAGLLPEDSTVVLVPVAGPEVTSTMSGVADELMARCLNVDEAKSLVSSTLRSTGVESFEISTDGPMAYPSDQKDAVLAHVNDGCVVYSGNGSNVDGALAIYLSGGAS